MIISVHSDITNNLLYLQLKNANNAEKSTVVIKALLDIKPIIADKNAKHPNDKPNGISTCATLTKPIQKKNSTKFQKTICLLGASLFHNTQLKSFDSVEKTHLYHRPNFFKSVK